VLLNLSESSADDLMLGCIESLLNSGERISPSRGPAIEVQGATLELTNPRARLGRSETRGRVFSCLGELCWYLSGSNSTDAIVYYLSKYRDWNEGGIINGGYGPRLFNFDGINQIAHVIEKLALKPSSRQAVIQIFDRHDVAEPHKDVPCTCTLQFLVRSGALLLITHMRSNDVTLGLPHDIFAFTMLQELVARSVGVRLGPYVHMVGSLHLYESDVRKAEQFLAEGWQSTIEMPNMPEGDPWPAVQRLIGVESAVREGTDPLAVVVDEHPYWADLGRLLVIYGLFKADRVDDVPPVREELNSRIYDIFITDRIDPL
jgi:thymidylate synthase